MKSKWESIQTNYSFGHPKKLVKAMQKDAKRTKISVNGGHGQNLGIGTQKKGTLFLYKQLT